MCGEICADCLVALRAETVVGWAELLIEIYVGVVGTNVAGDAGCAALEKTRTLPEAECIVGKAASAAIGPVRGIFGSGQSVFEVRQKVIVVICASAEAIDVDVAE